MPVSQVSRGSDRAYPRVWYTREDEGLKYRQWVCDDTRDTDDTVGARAEDHEGCPGTAGGRP
jgi:hypothetical protein